MLITGITLLIYLEEGVGGLAVHGELQGDDGGGGEGPESQAVEETTEALGTGPDGKGFHVGVVW